MNNIAKKIFALGSAVTLALSAMTPLVAHAAAHAVGTNINNNGTIGMIMPGNCLSWYTSAGAFTSYGFNSWTGVVTASAEDLALPNCSMNYIPPQDGQIIISDRGADLNTAYFISGGQKRGFVSRAVYDGSGFPASRLVGAAAVKADVSWMSTGANIDNAAAAHLPGALVNKDGTILLVGSNGTLGIPDLATFSSWGYSFANTVMANTADRALGMTGVMAMRQPGQLSPTALTTPPVVVGPVSASLDASNPAAGTLVAGQARADLAHFNFTGNGTVTTLKLKRIGVSSDSTLSSLFLYDGATRLTDSATVSSGFITFNDASGLFNVSGSRNISVQANIAGSTSGQTVGVMVDSFMMGTSTGTGQPSGNIHTIATVSDFATVDFNTTTTPSAATITAQGDYIMWQNTITVGVRKVWLKSIAFRQIGSVLNSDLANFRFYVDGTMKGTAVASLNSKGYVVFDFSGSPISLETGSRQLKMVGDIVGGSNRTFSFSMQQASDAQLTDSQYNAGILPTAASSTFSARSSGTQTVDTGTLQITKRTDSPSSDVVPNGSNVVLGRYDVKAFGENMKIESLRVRIDDDDSDTAYTLRNGAVYLDGVQIGSTAAIAGDSDSTLAYTEFTFGSSAIIVPNNNRILEVRADIYDNDGSNDVTATDTLQVEVGAGSNNVQRMTSLGYTTAPAAYVEANTLTVATGSVTLAKNNSTGDQTFVAPATGRLLGSFNIQANATEGATLTSVEVDSTTADAADVSDDVTNMYIKVGTYTSPIKPTVTDDDNTFSINVALAAGQSMAIEVYGDVASSATDGDGTPDTFVMEPTVSYTTLNSGTSTTTATPSGQTMTAGSGSFTVAAVVGDPADRIVAGGGSQEVTAGKFTFQGTNDTFTINELDVTVPTASAASAVTAVKLYDGATQIGPVAGVSFTGNDGDSGTGNKAAFTGLNWQVTGTKILTVKFVLNTIGTGAGTSGQNVMAQIDRTKYQNSVGTVTTLSTDYNAEDMYVYRSIPTVSFIDTTNSTLVMGAATDLYKFSVTASSQGPVAIKQFKVNVAWDDGGTADTLEVESLKFLEGSTSTPSNDITSLVDMTDEDGNTVESTSGLLESDDTLVIPWTAGSEYQIPAGETRYFLVRGTPTGFRQTGADTVGDSVSLYLKGDATQNGTSTYVNDETDINAGQSEIYELFTSAAASSSDGTAANFIWSDYNSNAHTSSQNASSSGDWFNGYKVLNLDLSGETWTK